MNEEEINNAKDPAVPQEPEKNGIKPKSSGIIGSATVWVEVNGELMQMDMPIDRLLKCYEGSPSKEEQSSK